MGKVEFYLHVGTAAGAFKTSIHTRDALATQLSSIALWLPGNVSICADF